MAYPIIDDWSVLEGSKVHGRIYSHKDFTDGTYVTTPRISDVFTGGFYTIVVADSGFIYRLGSISDKYRDWITEKGNFDPF